MLFSANQTIRFWVLALAIVLAFNSRGLAQMPTPLAGPRSPSAETEPKALHLPSGSVTANAEEAKSPSDTPSPSVQKSLITMQGGLEKLQKNLRVTTANEDFLLILGGTISADLLYNSARPVAPGVPFFLAPQAAPGIREQTVDGNARQSTLFAVFKGPKLGCEWETGGTVAAILYDNSVIADLYGLLPLLAYGEIKNDWWRFAAGLQEDVVLPLKPSILPFSVLWGSGNVGAARMNAQVSRFLYPSPESKLKLTFGVSQPITTIINDKNLSIVEDNGWPNLEGRCALALGPLVGEGPQAKQPIEIGLSGVVGQLRRTQLFQGRQIVVDVWGAGFDGRWAFNDRCGIRGEIYAGQALGEYNGAIMQNLNLTTFDPIRSVGGWAEFYYYLCPETLHAHIGYGIDDPRDSDLAVIQPLRNETFFANLIWDVTKYVRIAGEFTYRKTGYNAFNDNEGFGLQTQFQWKF